MKKLYTIRIVGLSQPYILTQEDYDKQVKIIHDSVGASQEIVINLKKEGKKATLRSTAFMVLEEEMSDGDYQDMLDAFWEKKVGM